MTGLSCGGFGMWEYLAEYGDEQVAAAVPIAGDGSPRVGESGCGLSEVPIWAIHGDLDDVVNPAGSIDPSTSLSGCPGVTPDRAKLSIYDGVDARGVGSGVQREPWRRHLLVDAQLHAELRLKSGGEGDPSTGRRYARPRPTEGYSTRPRR